MNWVLQQLPSWVQVLFLHGIHAWICGIQCLGASFNWSQSFSLGTPPILLLPLGRIDTFATGHLLKVMGLRATVVTHMWVLLCHFPHMTSPLSSHFCCQNQRALFHFGKLICWMWKSSLVVFFFLFQNFQLYCIFACVDSDNQSTVMYVLVSLKARCFLHLCLLSIFCHENSPIQIIGNYPMEINMRAYRNMLICAFIAALFIKNWKQIKYPLVNQ